MQYSRHTTRKMSFNDTANQDIVSLKIKIGWGEVNCVVKNKNMDYFLTQFLHC